jgi:hypothetical protein
MCLVPFVGVPNRYQGAGAQRRVEEYSGSIQECEELSDKDDDQGL